MTRTAGIRLRLVPAYFYLLEVQSDLLVEDSVKLKPIRRIHD